MKTSINVGEARGSGRAPGERDWSWLSTPSVPLLLGGVLVTLEATAHVNLSRPLMGVLVGVLGLVTVIVTLRAATGRRPYRRLRPRVAAVLWLAAVPGVALGVAILGSASLAAFLVLPAMAAGYGLSDVLNRWWPVSVAVALVGASVVVLIARLGAVPAMTHVVAGAVASALLLAIGVVTVRVLAVPR